MRNFEERKAEIFRRSEERIIERKKKRNRILSICIPLFICIGAYSIFILPAMMPAKESADNNVHQELEDIADVAAYPVTVEFFDIDGNLTDFYTGAEDINSICGTIDTVINAGLSNEETSDENYTEDSYSITVVDSTGRSTVYRISGNTLFNTATNNSYTLTDQQKGALDLFRKE
ncbi:MAG: hypothetical protein IJZ35_05755 [Clostridia bacterium]|nr:hypothetical protein [Clostridia bacterium]